MSKGEQTVRQQARLRARRSRQKVRAERVARERRLSRLGEQVAVLLAEQVALVRERERRAGVALRAMVEQEGLSVRQALDWCGVDGLTVREATRLIRAAAAEDEGEQDTGDRAGADQEAGPDDEHVESGPGGGAPPEAGSMRG